MSGPDMSMERLYLDVGPAVWNYLRRRLADLDDAEELFQETFLAVAANLARLHAVSSERAWLIGIARNLLREHMRHQRRRPCSLAPDQSPASRPDREDRNIQAMREAIARLPDAQREVLELRLDPELSYVEIAEALQIPVGTVRSRMHSAVTALRSWANNIQSQAIDER